MVDRQGTRALNRVAGGAFSKQYNEQTMLSFWLVGLPDCLPYSPLRCCRALLFVGSNSCLCQWCCGVLWTFEGAARAHSSCLVCNHGVLEHFAKRTLPRVSCFMPCFGRCRLEMPNMYT